MFAVACILPPTLILTKVPVAKPSGGLSWKMASLRLETPSVGACLDKKTRRDSEKICCLSCVAKALGECQSCFERVSHDLGVGAQGTNSEAGKFNLSSRSLGS